MTMDPHNHPAVRDNHRDRSSPRAPVGTTRYWLTGANSAADPELDSLNRALVAGLMLEVMLEHPTLVEEPGSGCHRLKAYLRKTLAVHLAGRIPLASFHTLAQGLDHWFAVIYPLLADAGQAKASSIPVPAPPPPQSCSIREDLFSEALAKTPGLIPQRRHRKLDREKLKNFLENTGGKWFRLRDFETHFGMDRKTSWEYVQKLLQVGVLVHNQGHSSAVRYRVEPRFLQSGWMTAAGPAVKAALVDSSH
jgi:hypothetical protein